MRRALDLGLGAWLLLTAAAGVAHAQAQPRSAAGEELFNAGRELLKRGHSAEACSVLEQSLAAARAVGTLLNLGLCHKECGRLASAFRYYSEAAELAQITGDEERLALARAEVTAVDAQVGSLTLDVVDPSDDSLRIAIDERPYPREAWGRPLRLDAGQHILRVQAAGRRSYELHVTTLDGENRVSRVSAPAPVTRPSPSPPASPARAVPALALEADHGGQRTLALASAGTGVLALGAALVFAALAASSDSQSDAFCTARGVCEPRGVSLRAEAHRHANWSTALTIGGGVTLAAGALLWLTLPDEQAEKLASRGRSPL